MTVTFPGGCLRRFRRSRHDWQLHFIDDLPHVVDLFTEAVQGRASQFFTSVETCRQRIDILIADLELIIEVRAG